MVLGCHRFLSPKLLNSIGQAHGWINQQLIPEHSINIDVQVFDIDLCSLIRSILAAAPSLRGVQSTSVDASAVVTCHCARNLFVVGLNLGALLASVERLELTLVKVPLSSI